MGRQTGCETTGEMGLASHGEEACYAQGYKMANESAMLSRGWHEECENSVPDWNDWKYSTEREEATGVIGRKGRQRPGMTVA